MKNILGLLLLFIGTVAFSQIDERIYKDTKIINLQSVETLKAKKLDFRIGHKFGDFAGGSGGWSTFFGLENASDVLIGLNYGFTDNLMIGISRTKGSGSLRQNINGQIKYRLLRQGQTTRKPFSLTAHAMFSLSTMPKGIAPSLSAFDKFLHRFTYHVQVIGAKKFGQKISAQVNAAWTYRNVVPQEDTNDLVSLGFSVKYQFSRVFAIILENVNTFSQFRKNEGNYYPATGIGFEWETGGGHLFQFNVTNATGIMETDYIPYTQSSWSNGQYRLGFTISRLFTL